MKEFLEKLICEAGELSLEYHSRVGQLQVTRKTEKDLVTEADKAVEEFIVGKIRQAYPEHGIFGEESGVTEGNEYCWVIDPIDGTSSFVHGQPFYSVSIGLEKDGQGVLAAVNVPVMKQLFVAEKGKGATLNGEPIHVSKRDKLVDSHLGTGFACLRSDMEHNNLPYFNAIMPLIRGVRRYGSAAADLCYVACGLFDGFWELNLAPYDTAAGKLILTEAGGTVSDFSGGIGRLSDEIVATNGLIHQQVVDVFTDVRRNLGLQVD